VAGDRLRTTVHVDRIVERAGITLVTTRAEIADAEDAPVATVVSVLAVRGEGR
jgi:acyl dehydratase